MRTTQPPTDTTIGNNQPLEELTAEQMREMLGRYRRILNGSGYGFWEWNLTTNVIDWSGGFWERLGYTESDRQSFTNAAELPNYIHPDDRELMHEAVRDHLRTAIPLYTCYRILTKAGDYVWTQVRADSIRDDNGLALYISGVNFDITELKAVEEALRESEARQMRIIQASNDGIWEWYADGGDFHFSSRCWEHLGYNQNDDGVNQGQDRLKEWRSHIHKDDLALFDDALRHHMMGRGAFDIEYRVHGKYNDIRWIRARGRANFDAHNNPVRMSGTNMDITDIKRAEERVLHAKEVAEKANKAKSEFLSSMSHELRTPLNAILGYAQLFAYDESLSPAHKENIGEIKSAGEHLLKLINDVLDLAKVEAGKMTVKLQSVPIFRLISDCLTLVQTQADAKGIYLHSHLNNMEQVCITADPVRLKQALLNLLSNAIKYNKVGGEVIVQLISSGSFLRIKVSDTGIGIARHRHQEVFQPFNRLQAELSKVEGSGVGLVITKQLIEKMHGSIHFTSELGEGTCFWVDLPLCHNNTEMSCDPQEPPAQAVEQLPLRVSEHPVSVLYVEDNPTNVRLLQQLFHRFDNVELHVAEEPYRGIYMARQLAPDVIILDINLPGLDGYEVLRVLQGDSATRAIPVIGLSANVMDVDVQKGREAGFYEYLTKPLQIDQLVKTFNELLAEEHAH